MIRIKSEQEISIMREGGKKLSRIVKLLAKQAVPGANTADLEHLACQLIKKIGGRPAFKEYQSSPEAKPFPTALCTSINDEIVHAPSLPARELKPGDILKIDVGMEYPSMENLSPKKSYYFSKLNISSKGFYTDMAVSIPIGKIEKKAKSLLRTTNKALMLGINQVRPNKTLHDIAKVIQDYVESHGFSVVRELVGHGVGYAVHEEPQIPNYIPKNGAFENVTLKPGMVLAIEPMVNMGGWEISTDEDGFTFRTKDGSLSAHYEHTVAVTKTGNLIITE